MASDSKKKSLYIFSTDLPKGFNDVFMLPELNVLSEKETDIIVFPFINSEHKLHEINRNIKINECMLHYKKSSERISIWLMYIFFKMYFTDLIFNKGSFFKNIKNIKKVFSYFKSLYFKSDYLIKNSNGFKTKSIYYSYWWEEWNLILIILKLRGKLLNPKIVSRTHGYDLHTERQNNHILFRGVQLYHTDTIYTISKNGYYYLKNKYPKFKSKVVNFYLGTKDHGFIDTINNNTFNLVSVSDFRDVKRVWLIPEILKHINEIELKWTHIGGGKGMEEFKKKVADTLLPANITYQFTGFISNDEVYQLYKDIKFNLFINVSSSEGIPASIMEAISMGVPAVATDVGGTNEIVNAETGFLIPKDFDPKKVASEITDFLSSLKHNPNYRQKARDFWQNNFKDVKNNNDFANHLLSE